MTFNSSYYIGAVLLAPSASIGIPYPHYPSQSLALARIVPFRSGRLFAFLDDVHISKKIKNTSPEMIFALPKMIFALPKKIFALRPMPKALPKMISALPKIIPSSTEMIFALPKMITSLRETVPSSMEITFALPNMILALRAAIPSLREMTSDKPNAMPLEAKFTKRHSKIINMFLKIINN